MEEKKEQKIGHILFVDDELEFLETMKIAFSDSFQIYTATNEVDAWHILQTAPIDCVFLDINLGFTNGLEFLEKCKTKQINIPFILISGFVNKEKLLRAMRSGAVDVLEKPVDLFYLNTQIRNFIQSGRSVRKIQKNLKSVVTAVNLTDEKSIEFVEDYLLHVEMYKKRKGA